MAHRAGGQRGGRRVRGAALCVRGLRARRPGELRSVATGGPMSALVRRAAELGAMLAELAVREPEALERVVTLLGRAIDLAVRAGPGSPAVGHRALLASASELASEAAADRWLAATLVHRRGR